MKQVSLLIKPASASCNLRCRYCFYEDIANRRQRHSHGIMSRQTAEVLIQKAIDAAEEGVSFIFQGGEPMLAGLDFFTDFVQTVEENNTKNLRVSYVLQTNGTLIGEDWLPFLARNRFLVGVSLDGTRDIHTYMRDVNGQGAYTRVLKHIGLLKKHHIEFNILTVVTKQVARHYQAVYNEYKKQGFTHLQFIPCIDDLDGKKTEFSLAAHAYGEFLVGLFRLWRRDYQSGSYISIQLFDTLINRLNGRETGVCSTNGCCTVQNVIEADGTVYPCDFYCLDEYRLGNIHTDELDAMSRCDTAKEFVKRDSSACRPCPYFALCRGGCRRDFDETNKTQYCESMKMLFAEILGEK